MADLSQVLLAGSRSTAADESTRTHPNPKPPTVNPTPGTPNHQQCKPP